MTAVVFAQRTPPLYLLPLPILYSWRAGEFLEDGRTAGRQGGRMGEATLFSVVDIDTRRGCGQDWVWMVKESLGQGPRLSLIVAPSLLPGLCLGTTSFSFS